MELFVLKIEKIQDGKMTFLFPVLLKIDNLYFLVDCGYEDDYATIEAQLSTYGLTLKDLTGVIITHDDIDHLGSLKLIKDANPNLQVYCGQHEQDSVVGLVKSERLVQAEQSLDSMPEEYKPWALNFIERLKNIKRVKVDKTLVDGDSFENEITIVHTPGHTAGHISLFHAESKTLIAGDAIVFENGAFDIANPAFTLDIEAALKSVKKIRALAPLTIICYHGGIVNVDIDNKLAGLIEKYSS